MKVWITKYVFTDGITELEAETCEARHIRSGQMIKLADRPLGYSTYYHRPDWHETRREAVQCAEKMRQKKITSLRKQLAKLEAKTEWSEELTQ
jgi:hypothetical protein